MSGFPPNNSTGKNREEKEFKAMTDVALANDLVKEIGGSMHVGQMFRTVCKELNKRFPHKHDPENKWTERRLRMWWHNESKIVRYTQMCELFETAEAVRRAREDHAEYKKKTERLREMAQRRAAHTASPMAER